MALILILKSLMKELQITRYLRSSKIIASLLLLTGIILLRTPLYLGTRLMLSCFHPCPGLSSSPTFEHMRWPRKGSNILCRSVEFSKNPSGKTVQNCFIHKGRHPCRSRIRKTKPTVQPSPSWEVKCRRLACSQTLYFLFKVRQALSLLHRSVLWNKPCLPV